MLFRSWPGEQSRVLSPNGRGGWTPLRPLRGLQETKAPRRNSKDSRPGNRGGSACGTTHVARLEFPRETSLILRCAGKAGNPFQTTQGNRLSCRDQEGRRGSDEVVPGPSVFPSREPGFSLSCIGERNGNPLQCSCLENPRDGGAWWAAVYGVAQSRTRLK